MIMTMIRSQYRKPFSLPVAGKIVLALVLCLHQSAGHNQNIICKTLDDAVGAAAIHRRSAGAFNEIITAQLLGWENETVENANILNGICNLLALRDLAEHLQDIRAAYLSNLLQQNVQDACMWLYGDPDPDRDCEDGLRYFCFRKWTDAFVLNKHLDRVCSA